MLPALQMYQIISKTGKEQLLLLDSFFLKFTEIRQSQEEEREKEAAKLRNRVEQTCKDTEAPAVFQEGKATCTPTCTARNYPRAQNCLCDIQGHKLTCG